MNDGLHFRTLTRHGHRRAPVSTHFWDVTWVITNGSSGFPVGTG